MQPNVIFLLGIVLVQRSLSYHEKLRYQRGIRLLYSDYFRTQMFAHRVKNCGVYDRLLDVNLLAISSNKYKYLKRNLKFKGTFFMKNCNLRRHFFCPHFFVLIFFY